MQYESSLASIAFTPLGKTSRIIAGVASANIALSTPVGGDGILANQVQVYNSSATSIAYVAFGPTMAAATASAGAAGTSTSDYPVAPGAVIVITAPQGTLYAAVILDSGSATVLLTPGTGM